VRFTEARCCPMASQLAVHDPPRRNLAIQAHQCPTVASAVLPALLAPMFTRGCWQTRLHLCAGLSQYCCACQVHAIGQTIRAASPSFGTQACSWDQ
jgi:hypothetical protein